MPFFFAIVPEYQRLVHFRFGKLVGTGEKGPGFIFPLFPFIDQVVTVDLREEVLDVEPQTCITKDNAPVSVDMLIYLKVTNPTTTVLEVQDFEIAARGIAVTTLRAVVGDISLDDVLAKRDQINSIMQVKLDEVTDRWGVKVMAVEIREITPPRDIQEAMSRQMSAERNRRAIVLEADGTAEAAVKVAEGNKRATILGAEGAKQAAILEAEGGRQAAVLEAEGLSTALERIHEIGQRLDPNTMGLQYLEVMRSLATSDASKWIVPAELMQFAEAFAKRGSNGGGNG
ncbi:MAG: SPFH/Band 7/PHB domain protein [Chloroflexi bacterium]|nr:SPFH/Band 7/PHB domain protein [Chloroflexota bacterium]